MFPQIINVGASPNDGQGDPIRTAFIKTNGNFAELFALPNPTPPTTLVGKAGDVPGMYAYNSNYFYYCFGTWNGSSTIWAQVSQVNTVSVNKINNGNSNVSIAGANANVTITVNSVANIATFSTIGLSVAGNITGNYFIGDGSQLTNLPAGDYSNANVANYIPTYSGNIGTLTAVGNVETLSFFIGDGSQLTNLPAGNYSNANVGDYLPTYTGNLTGGNILITSIVSAGGNIRGGNINTVGNVTANYFLGDGSQLTNLPAGNYSNANVASYLPTYTGNISGGNLGLSGAVNALGEITSFANIVVSPGGYFQGDGSQLTNLPAGNYGNANVADYLPTYTGNITANIISTTGNITTAGYFVGNFDGNISGNIVVPGLNTQVLYNENGNAGASAGLTFDAASNVLASTGNISTTGNVISLAMYTSSVVSAGGNVRGSNLNTTGNVSASGNVIGAFLYGDGSNIINLPAGNYSNSNVASYLPTYSGNLSGNNVSITGNIVSNNSVNITSNGVSWIFDTDGNLTAPLNIIANGASPAPVIQNFTFDSFNGTITSLGYGFDISAKQSPVNGVGYNLVLSAGSGVSNIGGNVNINAGFGSSAANGNINFGSGPYTWAMNNDGSTTFGSGSRLTGDPASFTLNPAYTEVIDLRDSTTTGFYTNSGQYVIQANGTYSWSFDATGNLLTPAQPDTEIKSVGNDTNSISLAWRAAGNIAASRFTANLFGAYISANNGTDPEYQWQFSPTGDLTSPGNISAVGNVQSANFLTSGVVSATGNVTANNIIANSFVTSNGFFKLPSYSTVQISALTGMTGGEMVYDTDLQIVQAYQLNPATSTMGWVSWTVAVYQ